MSYTRGQVLCSYPRMEIKQQQQQQSTDIYMCLSHRFYRYNDHSHNNKYIYI